MQDEHDDYNPVHPDYYSFIELTIATLLKNMKYFAQILIIPLVLIFSQFYVYAHSKHEHDADDQKGNKKYGIITEAKDLIALGNPLEHTQESIGRNLSHVKLVDQEGKSFPLQNYFDKPFILSFIFLNCTEACSTITSNLSESIKLSGGRFGTDYRVLSLSFDIKNDTPEELKAFGLNFSDKFQDWTFAVGTEDSISELVHDIGITIMKDSQGNLNHLNMLTLVDNGGTIKKHIYGDAPDPHEIWKELKKILGK